MLREVADPRPAKGEIVVDMRAAALNHRDYWISIGQYAGIKVPIILGSDGAGEHRGKPVVICPSLDWGTDNRFQASAFRILGLPDNGTLAEQVVIPRRNIYPQPEHLTAEQAAAIPLAGLTAWRALFTRCQLQRSDKVLIVGIGGGVALFALQFAVATGAEVFVTSGSDEKIARAVQMGAKGGANYRTPDWDKTLKNDVGGFDVIVDSAAGDGFSALVNLANPGARIVMYGAGQGIMNNVNPRSVFWKQLNILGSTMGNLAEFKKMMAFINQRTLVPVVDSVFPLAEGNAALQRMAAGDQFGKIVLTI